MIKITFYDTKPYDKKFFDEENKKFGFDIHYYETKLSQKTAVLAKGSKIVIAFVNDTIDKETVDALCHEGVELIAMRCAGYNNVDLDAAQGKIAVVRVPNYSPYAVAEHAMAMLLTLNRKIHKAFIRTRDHNFSLNGLEGFDLHGKSIGIIGTGNIGRVFADICSGFGMSVYAYDVYKSCDKVKYLTLGELFAVSDIISLHCPLTSETHHIINRESIKKMKDSVYIINTSRGSLIDSQALLDGILSRKIGGACLDVYEEETDLFHEDKSETIIKDDILLRLIAMPNVIVTSHQGFMTTEALSNIASTTLENISDFINNRPMQNLVFAKKIKSQ